MVLIFEIVGLIAALLVICILVEIGLRIYYLNIAVKIQLDNYKKSLNQQPQTPKAPFV